MSQGPGDFYVKPRLHVYRKHSSRVKSTGLLRFRPRLFRSDRAAASRPPAPSYAHPGVPAHAELSPGRVPPRGSAAAAPAGAGEAAGVRAARPGGAAAAGAARVPGLGQGRTPLGGRQVIRNCPRLRRHPSVFAPWGTTVAYLLFKRLVFPIKNQIKIITRTQRSNLHLVPLVQGCA